MAELNWTAEAEQWLRDIYDYIAADNPAAAGRPIESIYDKAQLLRRFPESGYRHQLAGGREIRILLFGHYRIAYLIKPDGNIDFWDASKGVGNLSGGVPDPLSLTDPRERG